MCLCIIKLILKIEREKSKMEDEMKKKRILSILLATIMILGLVACGDSSDDTASDEPVSEEVEDVSEDDSAEEVDTDSGTAGSQDITFVLSQRDEWLGELAAAAEAAAEELGYSVTVQDSLSDSSKQIQFVETAAAAGQEVVIVNPVDPNVCPEIVEVAGDTKVVFVNRPPADLSILNENVVYVGSDESTSGAFQGEWIADYFEEQGQTEISYILLNGILGQVSTELRTASVLQAMEDRGLTAVEASAPLACEYDRTEAIDRITPLLTSGLEFDVIISNNDAMALGAIEALENTGIDPTTVPIVGIDASTDGREAVKDGLLDMTVFQDPKGQGEGSIIAAINMIEGKPYNEGSDFELDEENEFIMWIPFEPVTIDNVDDYDNR